MALLLFLALIALLYVSALILFSPQTFLDHIISITSAMAEAAAAADGMMKDLKISEVKKSKKDGAPQKAAKKPQQQKKKVRYVWQKKDEFQYSHNAD